MRVKNEARRFNVVNCGRRFGKTVTGMDLCIDTALFDRAPAGWFAPEYKLLLEAWRETKWILGDAARVNEQEKRLEILGGGVIDFWAFDRNPNAGRSRKYKRIVIDEAAHCQNLELTWTKALRPTLTDYKGDAYFTSSPNGQNYFYTLYQKGQTDGSNPWKSWTFTSYDNPCLDPAEIDSARAELPDLVFRQEYLAEFLADVHATLIPTWWVDRASDAAIISAVDELRSRGRGGRRILAADLAVGSGRDRTTICVRDNLGVLDWVEDSFKGIAEAAKIVADLARKHDVADEDVIYDAGGPGRDFPRYLDSYRMEGTAYHGGAPSKGRWKNRRSRVFWKLRQRLDPERPLEMEPDAPIPESPWVPQPTPAKSKLQPPFTIPAHVLAKGLREELTGMRYSIEGGKIAMEDKDKFMDRLGRSPDAADALAMSMYSSSD